MSFLHLNIFPVRVPDVELNVGVVPFDSKDALRDLRDQHRGTHVFKRARPEEDELIYSIPLDGSTCSVASEHETIKLAENLGIARMLLNENFIGSFARTSNRPVVDVDPLKVLSSEADHDFLSRVAGGLEVPPWLIVRLAHIIDARVFEFEGHAAFLGLVFDYRAFRRISRPCSEWLADGFDLRGLYVSEPCPFHDTRIQPRLRLVGRVEKVVGTTLHLTDCREGREVVEASAVQMDADHEGFNRCLNAVFGSRAKQIDRDLFSLQSEAKVGPKKLGELTRIVGTSFNPCFSELCECQKDS